MFFNNDNSQNNLSIGGTPNLDCRQNLIDTPANFNYIQQQQQLYLTTPDLINMNQVPIPSNFSQNRYTSKL